MYIVLVQKTPISHCDSLLGVATHFQELQTADNEVNILPELPSVDIVICFYWESNLSRKLWNLFRPLSNSASRIYVSFTSSEP
jgi:hypothetical protein